MKHQTVAETLDALMNLQKIDSGLDSIKKLKGDLPEKVKDMEDEIEGMKVRMEHLEEECKTCKENISSNKEEIKKSKKLIEKYEKQQNNVKNNREYNAITKELELQNLEIQICEKKIKDLEELSEKKKEELKDIKKLLQEQTKELEAKRKGLDQLLVESKEEETALLNQRKKAITKVEDRLLKYYDRLRNTLSNGLAVVPVVKGAAQGCNIVIPPQKIVEIRERKKIVIDDHSGRILAYVETDFIDASKMKKVAKKKVVRKTRKRKTNKLDK